MDFRGGYATDIPNDLMSDHELLEATDCVWNEGLAVRAGRQTLYSFDPDVILGLFRARLNDAWTTIAAVDSDDVVTFYREADTETPEPIGPITFSAGADVSMAQLGDMVVAVNGVDKPVVIYHRDGEYRIETLERHDTRVRSTTEWNAGAFGGVSYTDDTADAQSDGEGADFEIHSGVEGAGFFVACETTFNRITVHALQSGTTATAVYEFWGRSGWTAFEPLSPVDWSVEGDKQIEWDLTFSEYELDMRIVDDPALESLHGRYAVRVIFTEGNPVSCRNLSVENTQYLSVITAGEAPHLAYAYKSYMLLATRTAVHLSPLNSLTGWRASDIEIFEDGGARIQAMAAHLNALCVLKEGAIYTLAGNSFLNWNKQLAAQKGTIAPKSVAVINDTVYFLARDGVNVWDGVVVRRVSKHIESELRQLSAPDGAAATVYAGRYYLSFEPERFTLTCDPDTIRSDSAGDGRVSFYRYSYAVAHFLPCLGADDTGALLGASGGSISRLEYGQDDDGEPVTMRVRTKLYGFSEIGQRKVYSRLKPELSRAGLYTIQLRSDTTWSGPFEIDSGTGDGTHSEEVNVPYAIDGRRIGMELVHVGPGARLIGVHLGYSARAF